MPKFKVHVCRIAYSHLYIDVEAPDSAVAIKKAEEEAPNRSFPSENDSKYEAQGCTEIS